MPQMKKALIVFCDAGYKSEVLFNNIMEGFSRKTVVLLDCVQTRGGGQPIFLSQIQRSEYQCKSAE